MFSMAFLRPDSATRISQLVSKKPSTLIIRGLNARAFQLDTTFLTSGITMKREFHGELQTPEFSKTNVFGFP